LVFIEKIFLAALWFSLHSQGVAMGWIKLPFQGKKHDYTN